MRSSIVITIVLATSVSALATKFFDRRDIGGLCSVVGSECNTDVSECCQDSIGFAFCNDQDIIEFHSCLAACGQDGPNASCQ